MIISNLKDLKEAQKRVDSVSMERRFLALTLMNKSRQYQPEFNKLYKCEYCNKVSSFWGTCDRCGCELWDMDDYL